MRLLLFSNSTKAGEEYLSYAGTYINKLNFGNRNNACFIPFAGVSISYDNYFEKVQEALPALKVASVHNADNPVELLQLSDIIIVGGGNTFHLLYQLQKLNLMEPIKQEVLKGKTYIGWSAGSNLACPTICTTNDMPIVQPKSFKGFGFVPFQINPHYTDATLHNHGGESRDDRINEYLQLNKDKYVVGLREGTMFDITEEDINLNGAFTSKIFKYGSESKELKPGDNFNFLLS